MPLKKHGLPKALNAVKKKQGLSGALNAANKAPVLQTTGTNLNPKAKP
jgi:hypothetical protein